MSDEETTKVGSLQSVSNKVKEKIRATFMDLIPEETWTKMVDLELQQFMKVNFKKFVIEEAAEQIKVILKEQFTRPEWHSKWDSVTEKRGPGEMVLQIIEEHSSTLVKALFAHIIQDSMDQISNNLNSKRY